MLSRLYLLTLSMSRCEFGFGARLMAALASRHAVHAILAGARAHEDDPGRDCEAGELRAEGTRCETVRITH